MARYSEEYKQSQINKFMKDLDISREEAEELFNYDLAVDKMTVKEAESDLTASQKKVIKQYKNCDRVINAFGKEVKRERKENKQKQDIINLLTESVNSCADNINIINPEREFTFTINNIKYKIVLSVPRT